MSSKLEMINIFEYVEVVTDEHIDKGLYEEFTGCHPRYACPAELPLDIKENDFESAKIFKLNFKNFQFPQRIMKWA